jgi:hypothetical protein
MAEYLSGSTEQAESSNILKLRRLNSNKFYKITPFNNAVYNGDFLMNVRISWPVKGAYKSMILNVEIGKE